MADNYQKIKNKTYILCIAGMIMAYFSAELKYALNQGSRTLFYISLHIGVLAVALFQYRMYSKAEGYTFLKMKKYPVILIAATVFMLVNRLFFIQSELGTVVLPSRPWSSMSTSFFLDLMYVFVAALPMVEFYGIGVLAKNNTHNTDYDESGEE